jgi:long-chain acyl-CoA synthetase
MWGSSVTTDTVRGVPVRVFEDRPKSIRALLDDAQRDADLPFLVQGAETRTRGALAARAAAVADHLVERGVAPGERVLLLAANSPAWVDAFFGIVTAGAVPVLGNGWWAADDVHHAVEVTSVRLAVVDDRRSALLPPGVVPLALGPDVCAHESSQSEPRCAQTLGGEDDPGLVMFTSGTTARPKAAVLSHRSVVANLQNLLVRSRQLPGVDERGAAGVHLCTLPLFHMSGIQTVLLNLLTGGRLVFLEGRFDAGQVLALIERERVTAWAAIPTMVALVLEHPALAGTDTSSLASLAIGGAPVPPDLRPAAERAFPSVRRRTGESYGSTEAGGTVATTTHDPASGVVGPRPFPTIDVQIADPSPDGSGEILVRSASVMDGYLASPAGEQPVDSAGWLHTGDLGRLDEHGVLHVTGRAKDLIIRAGENIAPGYVEVAMREHPAVLDVVVLGVPHATWGEEVAAVVRHALAAAPDEADLVTHASARLARFAVPTRWHLTVDDLPLTDTGKIRRDDLRKLFA